MPTSMSHTAQAKKLKKEDTKTRKKKKKRHRKKNKEKHLFIEAAEQYKAIYLPQHFVKT